MSHKNKMDLHFQKSDFNLEVTDKDQTQQESYWSWRDNRQITITKPKVVATMSLNQGACCALGEVAHFNFLETDKDLLLEIYKCFNKNLLKVLSRDKFSLIHLAFLKNEGLNDVEYQHKPFMEMLIENGWKEVYPEFYNRRYETRKERNQHKIKVLSYLIQSRKKGNAL